MIRETRAGRWEQGDEGREMRERARDADALRAPGMLFSFFLSYFTYTTSKGHLLLKLFLGTTNMNQGDDSE